LAGKYLSVKIDHDSGDHVDWVLAQWARERPDLDLAPLAVVARLGRLARYLDQGLERGLAEFGLTRENWDVLASLRRLGPPFRASPTDLYRGLMRTSGAMTQRLRQLQRAGLVGRVADPDDGRSSLVELTADGVRLTDRVAPLHLANERALLGALNADEREALAALLKTLLISFEQRDPGPPVDAARRRGRPRRHR
jgi:DNA-binding MarR family transcriptional regulator